MRPLLLAFLFSLLFFFLSLAFAFNETMMLLLIGVSVIMCAGWIVSTINIYCNKNQNSNEKDG
ncbi:hypothetical protein R9X47_11345 [Wukongibacter baidiensis]|uniref:hypothetical protein n=1 Tax=Wukongibacter baidiensis TaxID=1723361 RepID=UPI003D7F44AB